MEEGLDETIHRMHQPRRGAVDAGSSFCACGSDGIQGADTAATYRSRLLLVAGSESEDSPGAGGCPGVPSLSSIIS